MCISNAPVFLVILYNHTDVRFVQTFQARLKEL